MSKKDIKSNPLLNDESQAEPEAKATEAPKEVKAEPETPTSADVVAQTKALLDKQPKVNFMIPLSPGEQPGAYETVQINGYRLVIRKNEMVEIPQAVAQLLAEKYRINLTAGEEARVDRASDVTEALG